MTARSILLVPVVALSASLAACGGGGGGGGGGGAASPSFLGDGRSAGAVLQNAGFNGTITDLDKFPKFAAQYHPDGPTTTMPQNVSASYEGGIAGGAQVGNRAIAYTGDVAMQANFGAGTIAGQVTNTEGIEFDVRNPPQTPEQIQAVLANSGPLAFGLAMQGTINGNEYSGTTRMTDAAGQVGGTATSTRMTGIFVGDQAAETIGTVRYQGTAPASMGGGQTTLIGLYTADRTLPAVAPASAPPPAPAR